MEDLKDAPVLAKRLIELFYHYNPPDPSSPEVLPQLNSNIPGLTPDYLQVVRLDPLRDEALA